MNQSTLSFTLLSPYIYLFTFLNTYHDRKKGLTLLVFVKRWVVTFRAQGLYFIYLYFFLNIFRFEMCDLNCLIQTAHVLFFSLLSRRFACYIFYFISFFKAKHVLVANKQRILLFFMLET